MIGSNNIMDIIAVTQNNNLESSFNNLLEFIGPLIDLLLLSLGI